LSRFLQTNSTRLFEQCAGHPEQTDVFNLMVLIVSGLQLVDLSISLLGAWFPFWGGGGGTSLNDQANVIPLCKESSFNNMSLLKQMSHRI
jgi:hypothetical protein